MEVYRVPIGLLQINRIEQKLIELIHTTELLSLQNTHASYQDFDLIHNHERRKKA